MLRCRPSDRSPLLLPDLKSRADEARVVGGHERTLTHHRAEIRRLGIGYNRARIARAAEREAHYLIQPKRLWPSHLDDAVHRLSDCNVHHRPGNVLRRYGLDQYWRKTNLACDRCAIRDPR